MCKNDKNHGHLLALTGTCWLYYSTTRRNVFLQYFSQFLSYKKIKDRFGKGLKRPFQNGPYFFL